MNWVCFICCSIIYAYGSVVRGLCVCALVRLVKIYLHIVKTCRSECKCKCKCVLVLYSSIIFVYFLSLLSIRPYRFPFLAHVTFHRMKKKKRKKNKELNAFFSVGKIFHFMSTFVVCLLLSLFGFYYTKHLMLSLYSVYCIIFLYFSIFILYV